MEDPNFHLQGIVREKDELCDFEGPLSLILLLLQKNKIEIRDIVISDILDQYLAWLDTMQQMDLEVTSEFIQMASYLLLIKTKVLLTDDKEEVSELEALIQSLEQLRSKDSLAAVRQVMPALGEAYRTGALICSKMPEPLAHTAMDYQYHHDPVELLQALLSMFTATGEKPADNDALVKAIPHRIIYSVRDKTAHILSSLKERDFTLSELYSQCSTRSELVATFMAVLELCSLGSISVSLSEETAEYSIRFTGGDIDEILEKIED